MLIHDALRYKRWADRRTLDAVAAIDREACPSQWAFARQQLNHLVRVEELFRARLLGEPDPHPTTNSEVVPDLEELDGRLMAANDWAQAYLDTLSPTALAERIRFRFVDGKHGMLSREEALFHLVNHGTYHRGAIGHALDLAQAPRPADTYTVFIHAEQPERRGSGTS